MPPSLWDFSLATYARPGVAEACLALQDRFGQDVNLLLWALWLGTRGHRLRPDELASAEAAAGPWHAEVVVPLRIVRRRLKTGPLPAPGGAAEALRDRLKGLELEAERLEQEVLAAHPAAVRADAPAAEAASANLRLLRPEPEAHPFTEALHKAVTG